MTGLAEFPEMTTRGSSASRSRNSSHDFLEGERLHWHQCHKCTTPANRDIGPYRNTPLIRDDRRRTAVRPRQRRRDMQAIRWFEDIGLSDTGSVGGKGAEPR